MAITFSGACSAAAPVLYDTAPSQATGALSAGIGITGADAATPTGFTYIGGAAQVVKVESTGIVEAPAPSPPAPTPPEGRKQWN